MMRYLLAGMVACSWGSFSPQRTPMRDRIFFGLDEGPEIGPLSSTQALAPILPPPASSQMGVNMTAASDPDLNDYGSAGVPAEVTAKREKAAAEAAAAKMSFFSFGSSSARESSDSIFTARNILDVVSIIWLIGLIGGCYYFLSHALEGGNRKYRIMGPEKKESVKAAENMRIDREAYIYVADG